MPFDLLPAVVAQATRRIAVEKANDNASCFLAHIIRETEWIVKNATATIDRPLFYTFHNVVSTSQGQQHV